MMRPSLWLIAVISALSFSGCVSAQRTTNSIETIVGDMHLPHEGIPHGVPRGYDWATGPRIQRGNNTTGFQALTAWGQFYEDDGGNPAANTRVQIRNIRTYILGKQDGAWHLVQSSSSVTGAAYREDFIGNVHKPADIRNEPDGGISATAGGGYNFHFWPKGRVSIAPGNIAGVYATVQARLIVDNRHLPDDRATARYLFNMGGDYWLNLTAGWDNLRTNRGIAIGRFKYVTGEWQAFNMTTLTEDEIRRNPPPIE